MKRRVLFDRMKLVVFERVINHFRMVGRATRFATGVSRCKPFVPFQVAGEGAVAPLVRGAE
jgi:hypothetical protein